MLKPRSPEKASPAELRFRQGHIKLVSKTQPAREDVLLKKLLKGDALISLGHYVQARKAFPSDVALADALSVHRSRIAAWKRGTAPDESNARRLRDLALVVSKLGEVYDAELIPDWLASRDPANGERTPLQLLREDRLAEVLALVNTSASGAYS